MRRILLSTAAILASVTPALAQTSPQEAITLRHRAAPLIEMLRRCQQGAADIVWGV
jgi:hypothetical protein